ncbi:MAG: glycosyltransferase, partial [Alcaligenaceae bacterium]
ALQEDVDAIGVSILSGACCALRKDVFLSVGGFDAVNTPDGHSDMDLSYKLLDRGYRCVYTPHSLLHHIGNHSWGAKKYKYKADIFCLKHWGKFLSEDACFTDSMKRVLYTDFKFNYKIYASHIDAAKKYSDSDVLFVSHELSLTGAPRMLFYAAAAVVQRGGFAVVVAPEDGPMRHELERAGVVVIIDESIAFDHFLFKGFAKNFDVVVVNTITTALVVRQLSTIEDLKIVWWLHEGQALRRYLPTHADIAGQNVRLLCVSDYAQSFVPRKYRSSVLYNAIPDVEVAESRSTGVFTFILVGTIEPRKGQDIFVDAVLLLPAEVRRSCEFIIVGKLWELNRPFWNEVSAKMKDVKEISYLGSLEHEQALAKVAGSDVVVCSSRDEAFSLAAVEGAMLRKPTILNKHVGVSGVFKDKESCLLFESGDALSLTERMEFAFRNQHITKQIGKAARTIYEQKLSMERFSAEFLECINA